MSETTPAIPAPETAANRAILNSTRPARWWPGVAILVLGTIRQLWIWFVWPPESTIQTMHTYLSGIPTVFLMGLWWTFFSRLTWRTRLGGWAVVAACFAILACVFRIDDNTGEVIPILTWRWAPNREEVAAKYIETQPVVNSPAAVKVSGKTTEAALPALRVTDADWPEYRGRLRDGIVRGVTIRTDWEAHPPQALWRHPVGLGWSSFAVVDGLAFTQEQRRDQEAVVCYDVFTGKQVWAHTDTARFTEALGGDGPRATPTIHEGLLYSAGSTGILNCLDARTGKKIWSHDVLVENSIPNIPWGMTCSPLVYDTFVVINPGGANQQGLMAFDRLTGKPAWSAGIDGASYCTPQLSEVDGVRQLLLFDAAGIAGHDPSTGRQLWKHPWTNDPRVNAAQPIVPVSDQVFISNGYGMGSILLNVRHDKENWTVAPVWESRKLRLKFNSGVLQDHYVYGLDDGILSCLDLRDGKQKWKGGRYSFGQVLLVGPWLIVQAESGDVVLVKAVPDQFEEVARFPALNRKTWNNPALWKGLLLVRNGDEAACYDLR